MAPPLVAHGSVAMMWLLHRRHRRRFAGVRWRGLSGALRIIAGSATNNTAKPVLRYYTLVGIHGGLDEEVERVNGGRMRLVQAEEQARRSSAHGRLQCRLASDLRE